MVLIRYKSNDFILLTFVDGYFLAELFLQVSRIFEEGLKDGTVKPLATTVFPADKSTEAFRFMAQGKHMGKVLMKVRPDDKFTGTLKVKAVRRTLCDPRCSYV